MRKKRRTPAQIRATKKLVALNKKRRAKKASPKRKANPKRRVAKKRTVKKRVVRKASVRKRAVRKKVVRKRTVRKTNPVTKYGYVVMAQAKKGNKKGYYTGISFDTSIKKAAIFKSKMLAEKTASKVNISRRAWDLYVVKESINKLK